MRKLWTLGALLMSCALGWRLGHATQALGVPATEGVSPAMAAEPRPSHSAERALRRIVLRRVLREVVAPRSDPADVAFLPSVLEALLVERPASEHFSSTPPTTGRAGVARQAAFCRSEGAPLTPGVGPPAVAAATAPDALAILAELLIDPSCTGSSTPALR